MRSLSKAIHIIILTESPFSKRDYARFGIELLSRNFKVLILDCTAWLKPYFWDKYSSLIYACPGYVSVTGLDALVRCINGNKNTMAVDYLGNCTKSNRIRMELKNRNISRVIVHNGLLPNPTIKLSSRVKGIITTNSTYSILKKIYKRIMRMSNLGPAPDIALLSGTAGLKDRRLLGVTHKIWAHSFDYDLYLATKEQEAVDVDPYVVFLDEDIIYHSDYDHSEIKPPATDRTYYASMNRFFEKLECMLGLPVTIAAHPRSRYDLRPQLWNGRATIKGQTAQLVRDATLVLCHQSTSVSFSVLWSKPLLFLTTNELKKSYLGPAISFMSSLLGASLINVDVSADYSLNSKLLFNVNETLYSKYKDGYIKRSGTPNRPLWQIFSEYVQSNAAVWFKSREAELREFMEESKLMASSHGL